MSFPLEVGVATLATVAGAFPHEAVPDGHVAAPHHFYIGVGLLGAVVWVVGDNYRRREPLLAGGGALLALFGFCLTWQWYPVVGAALTLAGLCVALLGVCWPRGLWADYPLRMRLAALLGVAIALDDAIEHAFPIGSPLDWLWMHYLYPLIAGL